MFDSAGFVFPDQFRQVYNPLKLLTANVQALVGGNSEVLLVLDVLEMNLWTDLQMIVRLLTWCYEAYIRDDIILYNQWCHIRGMDDVAVNTGWGAGGTDDPCGLPEPEIERGLVLLTGSWWMSVCGEVCSV